MSKLACDCGNVISDVQCPNEVTGRLLSDRSGEVFFNTIAETIDDYLTHVSSDNMAEWREKHFNDQYPNDISAGHMIHDILTTRLLDLTLAVMECDSCGRLWVQRTPDANHYHGYTPDDDVVTRRKMLGFNISNPDEGSNE